MRKNNVEEKFFSTKRCFVFIMLIVSVSLIFSYSGPDENLIIITETSPLIPFVGLEWKITLLIDYPLAANVAAETPQYQTDYLRLDRVRTEPYRMQRGNAIDETWTRVEFFFVPQKSGQITIPPFAIKTPEKTALTPSLVFQIEAPYGSYVYQPELRWSSVPPSFVRGRKSELLLVMQNHDPQKRLEDFLPASITVPQDAILERLPLRLEDREKNTVLRLNIIPLKEGRLQIDPVIIEYDGKQLASPLLQIDVISSSLRNAQFVSEYTLSNEELNFVLPDEIISSYKHDENPSWYFTVLPEPLKKQYDEIVHHTNELWNNDEKVQALAYLRKAERDETIGFMLRPLRKNFEQELELGITHDESYLPVKLFFVLCAFFFIVSIVLTIYLFVSRKKQTSFSFFRIVCYVPLVISIVMLLIFGALGIIHGSGKRALHQAVVYYTDSYRVPEITGAISGSFKDGESAVIRSVAGNWLYLETDGGKSGWVPGGKVIWY